MNHLLIIDIHAIKAQDSVIGAASAELKEK
jgi:hypothetical protein